LEKTKPWARIFRFLFPKNFVGEIGRGMGIGKAGHVSEILGKKLYEAGKTARRKADPEHKMKIGSQKRKKQ